jgi:5-methylcytosine-specific restriction endonuclease McrA
MKRKFSKERERAVNVQQLTRLYGKRCWYCGQEIDWDGVNESIPAEKIDPVTRKRVGRKEYDGTRMEIDHIIPKSKGGDDSFENMALACGTCNKGKWDQGILEFLKWLAHIRSGRFNCFVLNRLPKEIVDKLDGTEWDRLRKEFFI